MSSSEQPQPLRVITFSAMRYEIAAFQHLLRSIPDAQRLDIVFVSSRLNRSTVSLANGARAVSLFVTDTADAQMLVRLHRLGVKLIALRYPGVSSVDVDKATQLGIVVTRTFPHAHTSIAEYTIALMTSLNRKVHIGSNRLRDGIMSLDGLMGFSISGSTVGIIGTGKVGRHVARLLKGFGCDILAYDALASEQVQDLGIQYVTFRTLLSSSDIITVHAPLLPSTYHLIGPHTLSECKKGVHIINTSRGGLIDTSAVIEALRSGQVGGLALDVYEGEADLFFEDHTGEQIDLEFQKLRSMPNVLITGHQSALTRNAIHDVVLATVTTLLQFHAGEELEYEVKPERSQRSQQIGEGHSARR